MIIFLQVVFALLTIFTWREVGFANPEELYGLTNKYFLSALASWAVLIVVHLVLRKKNKLKQTQSQLKFADILVTIVISLVFAVVYNLWATLYATVGGFGLQVDQLIYGMWFIAATVAMLVIRKPGVALLAEVVAASGEFMLGSPYGLSLLFYGILQGLGAELVFAAFRYNRFTVFVVSLAAIGSTIASLIVDQAYGYISDLALWNLALLIGARTLGAIIIAGIFAYAIVKALELTGVTNLVRPVSNKDYEALED
jgi:energy-coupling factor transport system permease protein